MSAALLEIRDLEYCYADSQHKVVNNVSFSIQTGSITAILGPNGAGKTTLIHLLLGLHKPLHGSVLLDGKPISSFSHRELSRWIGLVPQSEYIPFDFSILEYTLLGRAPYLGPLEQPSDKDVSIARQALHQVGMSTLEQRPIPDLSGGELQLVLIARALAQQPRILLLDEPTSHLDLSNRNNTLKILDRLTQDGATVLFTTHDPEAASLVADNLVLMRSGKVIHAGSLEDTLTNQKLSETYGTQIEVVNVGGMPVVRSLEHIR